MDVKTSLTYKQIQEGMVILSCVRQITNFSLQIELPGLTFGQVRITSISDPLNKYLTDHMDNLDTNDDLLKKILSIGCFIPAKVMSMKENSKGTKAEASINPKDINADKRHSSFKKGMLLWAAVQAELDHGYQLTCGVKNCTVFLPSKNVQEGKHYEIGEPLWCVVHRYEDNQTSSILRVSAKWEHINKSKLDDLDSLHNVIPGMQVDFFADKLTRNGIEGKFLLDYSAYVDQTQLSHPLKTLDKMREGKLYNARILYVEPTTNIVHLTLRGLETVAQSTYSLGHVMTVEILNKTPRGLFVKLDQDEKGFITNKRLLRTLPKEPNMDLNIAVRKKYPVGSKKQCRIIDYNHMERMYICTFETHIVKEKLFTLEDLSVGQLVTVTVEDIKTEGLVVNAGHVKGFVQNIHLTNTEYSHSIKKKFNIGMTLPARVWNITDQDNVLFTLKQALVESGICLKDMESAKHNLMHPGVVVQAKQSGALVGFYNGIVGWISVGQLSHDQDMPIDPREYYYKGQVAMFRLLEIKNNRLKLSSKAVSFGETKKRTISEESTNSTEDARNETAVKKKKNKTKTKNYMAKDEVEDSGLESDISQETQKDCDITEGKYVLLRRPKREGEEITEDIANPSKKKKVKQDHDQTSEEMAKTNKNKRKNSVSEDKVPESTSKNRKKKKVDADTEDKSSKVESGSSKKRCFEAEYQSSESKDSKKRCFRNEEETIKKTEDIKPCVVLPGIEEFFCDNKVEEPDEESSSDEEIECQDKIKKKKLSRAERVELCRLEEERIRKIEKELSTSKMNPQSAAHFDRLVTDEPDNAQLWLQYIAFHVSCMELDKARVVAKKALETIKMTLLEEKFSVWLAYLHLENMYGTKESFEKVFEDAVKYNDSLNIYLRSIQMLAESGKMTEMEEKVKKVKGKYKQSPQMWEGIGRIYYHIKNFREARNCKDMALKSIQDKKIQLNLIVRFAIMEFRYGEEDAGAAIFETILQSDPRKVNIWITYVDQLTKKGSTELARKVLDRSVCQKLPVKSMKTLFIKFRTFEEKYGTPESVQEVKRRAAEYVQNK